MTGITRDGSQPPILTDLTRLREQTEEGQLRQLEKRRHGIKARVES
jgi:hypothetical protein